MYFYHQQKAVAFLIFLKMADAEYLLLIMLHRANV
jgi:hypothetical protein